MHFLLNNQWQCSDHQVVNGSIGHITVSNSCQSNKVFLFLKLCTIKLHCIASLCAPSILLLYILIVDFPLRFVEHFCGPFITLQFLPFYSVPHLALPFLTLPHLSCAFLTFNYTTSPFSSLSSRPSKLLSLVNCPLVFVRRLVFLQSQNFIQTEVRLIEKKENSSNSKSGSGKGKDKKTAKAVKDKDKDKKTKEESNMEFDYTYLDDHHRAVLTSRALTPDIILRGSKSTHKTSSSSMASAPSASSSSCSQLRDPTGLIIGLGGGAMPMCLQRYLPSMRLTTCEMDGEMHGIAVKHFAFK